MLAAAKKSANAVIDDVQAILSDYEGVDPHTSGLVRQAVGEVLVQDGTKGLQSWPEGEKTRPARTNALVFVFVGLLFAVIGGMMVASGPKTDSTTTGTVQQVVRSHSSGSSSRSRDKTTCSLIVAFKVGEREYTADSSVRSSSDCRHEIGDQVEVRYSAANPAENEAGSKQSTFGLLFGGVGALAAFTGLWATAVAQRNVTFGRQLINEGADLTEAHPSASGGDAAAAEARGKVTALLLSKRGGRKKFTPFKSSGGADSAKQAGDQIAPGALPSSDGRGVAHAHPDPSPDASADASADASPVVQPGWYPTADGGHVRWHDGASWTDHVQPLPPRAPST